MTSGASVNVLDFGATGDGVTDDTVAIQAAIDVCANQELYFPKGTYNISSTLNVTGRRISLSGGSVNSRGGVTPTIEWVGATSGIMFNVGAGTDALGTVFSSLRFSTDIATVTMIDGSATLNMVVENCSFYALTYGISILLQESAPGAIDGPYWNKVRDCYFTNGRIELTDDANATFISNNEFYTTYSNPGSAISCVGDINHIVIDRNIFEGNWDAAIYAVSVSVIQNLVFTDNRIENYSGKSLQLSTILVGTITGNLFNTSVEYTGTRVTSAHSLGQRITEHSNLSPNKNTFSEINNLDGVFPTKNLFNPGYFALDWYLPNTGRTVVEDGSLGLRTPVFKLHTPTAATSGAVFAKNILDIPEVALSMANESFITFVLIVKAKSTNTATSVMFLDTADGVEYVSIPKDDKWHVLKISRRMNTTETKLHASIYHSYASTFNAADELYIGGVGLYAGTGGFSLPFFDHWLTDPATSLNTKGWVRGEKVLSATSAPSGVEGWICTAAGSPGTWKTFGSIGA